MGHAQIQDEPRTGGFGWLTPERVTVDDVKNVLADKCQFDPNGLTAGHYTRRLDANYFFHTLNLQMQQQILRMIVQSKGVGYAQVREYLDFEIKGLLGEDA